MAGIHAEPFHHGTHAAYSNRGCRCEECKEAGRIWRRDWYARNRDKRIAQVSARKKRQQELARALPQAPMTGKRWTADEDITVLRKDCAVSTIAEILQRSSKSVAMRREALRRQGREWS